MKLCRMLQYIFSVHNINVPPGLVFTPGEPEDVRRPPSLLRKSL